jgi:hypothetical protein
VRFRGNAYYYGSSWYGGASVKADAATVTARAGKKTAGVNGTVAVKPSISGHLTVGGKEAVVGTRDGMVVNLLDPSGRRIARSLDSGVFSFVEKDGIALTPGNYTLSIRPKEAAADFFDPTTVPVTLAPGDAIRDLAIDLTATPLPLGEKGATQVEFTQVSSAFPTEGKSFRAKIELRSYGSVTGGTVSLYVAGKKIVSKKVPSSGHVTLSTRFTGIKKGDHNIRVVYSGTGTTLPRNIAVGAMHAD